MSRKLAGERRRQHTPPEPIAACPVCAKEQIVRAAAEADLHCVCPGSRVEAQLLLLPERRVLFNELPPPDEAWLLLEPARPAELRPFLYEAVDAFWPSAADFRRDIPALRANRHLLVATGPPVEDRRREGWIRWRFSVNLPPWPDDPPAWPPDAVTRPLDGLAAGFNGS